MNKYTHGDLEIRVYKESSYFVAELISNTRFYAHGYSEIDAVSKVFIMLKEKLGITITIDTP